jgi:hypothetical protein
MAESFISLDEGSVCFFWGFPLILKPKILFRISYEYYCRLVPHGSPVQGIIPQSSSRKTFVGMLHLKLNFCD